MLRKIKLYGKLAKFIGHRVLEADVATAAEAVRFLLANWPEAEAHMNDQHYRVSVGTYDIDLEELHHPAGAAPISIVPVVAGAGATGRIIAGIALIALSFGIASLAAGAALAGSLSGFALQAVAFGTQAGLIAGIGLVLGGVAQLLTPTPKISQDEGDPRKSFSFSGIQNTNRAGVPVPVVYGETLVGSVVISAGIDIVQVSA
jgi:predicted phage tail protein